MGQNVARPTDQFLSLLGADASHMMTADAAVASVPRPVSAEPPFALALHGGAAVPQTSGRTKAIFSRIDASIKRSIDVVVSLVLLIGAAPLFLFVAVLVSLDGGKVFFGHARVGQNLRTFRCLKFRTMIPNAEATLDEYLELNPDAAIEWNRDNKLEFDIRVTPVGRLLRQTSLDELPQLWNVLRGDMSLVGPRPITAQESRRYGSTLNDYAGLRPGMTGLWQVSGRSDIGYEGRVALDAHYVRHRSLWVDLTILLVCTPKVLVSRKGAR